MEERPGKVMLRARGELACFSRPEFSVERTSYPWITPSAARALFEAVLWKPRIRYEVREISLLKPIKYIAFKRNEIGCKVPSKGLTPAKWIETDEERQQRNTMALAEVDYMIRAEIFLHEELKSKEPDDNHGKYVGMFERRLEKGQHFHQPYMGCREFAADVLPVSGEEKPIPVSMDHGLMLYDFQFPTRPGDHRNWEKNGKPHPLYFNARLVEGVVSVPQRKDALGWKGGQA